MGRKTLMSKNIQNKPGRKTLMSKNAGDVTGTSKATHYKLLIWQFSNAEE